MCMKSLGAWGERGTRCNGGAEEKSPEQRDQSTLRQIPGVPEFEEQNEAHLPMGYRVAGSQGAVPEVVWVVKCTLDDQHHTHLAAIRHCAACKDNIRQGLLLFE